MDAILAGLLWLSRDCVDFDYLVEELRLLNPSFEQQRKLGLVPEGEQWIDCYHDRGDWIGVPPYLDKEIYSKFVIGSPDIVDRRTEGYPITISSSIILRPYQVGVPETLINFGNGILKGPPGSGKTNVMLYTLCKIRKSFIILTHTKQIASQWINRIKDFTDCKDVVLVGSGSRDWNGEKVVVGLVQTLYKGDMPKEFYEHFGVVVADEINHYSAPTFVRCLSLFPARHKIGLSATPYRSDGLTNIFKWLVGPIVAEMNSPQMIPSVIMREYYEEELDKALLGGGKIWIKDEVSWSAKDHMPRAINILVANQGRNELIFDYVKQFIGEGRKILVLSARVAHCELLGQMSDQLGHDYSIITGKKADVKEREKGYSAQVIYATQGLMREAIDIDTLDTLLFTCPFGGKDAVEQGVGRLMRAKEGKKELIVVDIVDKGLGTMIGLYKRRLKYYNSLGFNVTLSLVRKPKKEGQDGKQK